MLDQPSNARQYAQRSLKIAQQSDLEPFYLGYAYEALARIESVDGNPNQMLSYLQKARESADSVTDPSAKKQLLDDLAAIRTSNHLA
jgi:hypothetical protein